MRGQVNDKAHMELILKSIDNVFEFTAKHETYEQFEADKICCHAVTYNIQCIGESVYKMSQEFKEAHPDTEWHLISGMRHVLVHDYYQVSFKFIWNVIKHDLNPLREQIEKYLGNM
jgi:uncharacterized protein with HEPN domain